jgi:hypothetical protein
LTSEDDPAESLLLGGRPGPRFLGGDAEEVADFDAAAALNGRSLLFDGVSDAEVRARFLENDDSAGLPDLGGRPRFRDGIGVASPTGDLLLVGGRPRDFFSEEPVGVIFSKESSTALFFGV